MTTLIYRAPLWLLGLFAWIRVYPRLKKARSSVVSDGGLVVFAEVGFDDLGVVLDRGRRAFGDFHAVVEHGDAFAHAHDHAHRMLDEEDGELELFAHARDEFHELGFFGRVHA